MHPSLIANAGQLFYPLHHAASPAQSLGGTPGSGAGASAPAGFSGTYGVQSTALLALSQIGATSAPATTAGATAGTPGGTAPTGQAASSAVQTFLQSLYAALQAQAALNGTGEASAGGATSATAGTSTVHGHRGHGHHGDAGLTNVVQQLNASVASASTSSASAAAGSSSSAISALEQSFNGLVSATGESGNSQATLTNFLNAFANDLSSRPAGTLLSVRA